MSILKKIMTALRGGAREVAESIVDANSTRIFEQEIRDAKGHLHKAKNDLTEVMARQMQAERELERISKAISEHEGYAAQALEKGNENLALEIAEKIASLEGEKSEHQSSHENYKSHANRLKSLVQKTERQLKDYERQLSMVKTTESVQKATATITDNFSSSNSRILSAKESLERIKKKQEMFDDKLAAAQELEHENSDKSLQDKLEAAGISQSKSSASDVLARIKAGKKGGA